MHPTDTHAANHSRARESLLLCGFGVAYGQKVVLSSVDLAVPQTGVMTLAGPTAAGKSTLLRTVVGFNKTVPSLATWGECLYRGRPLADDNRPELVSQNSRLLASTLLENLLYQATERFESTPEDKRERAISSLRDVGLEELSTELDCPVVRLPLVVQRLVAIARLLPAEPDLLCVDEPTYGLDEADAARILRVLAREGERRAVLVVLHNQRQIQSVGGHIALLAGGVIQETQPTAGFFARPLSAAGRQFRHTGSCCEPSPDADAANLDPRVRRRINRPPRAATAASEALGPRGFAWLLPGRLAGTPRPGVVGDVDYDLTALRRVGVSVLVSLTRQPLAAPDLERANLRAYWYPIPDMGAPTLDQAMEICRCMDRLLGDGEAVAVHCRAGLGRTGTILAAYLIWHGRSAIGALETVRRIEPKWVQSQTQIEFLEKFAGSLAEHRAKATPAAAAAA